MKTIFDSNYIDFLNLLKTNNIKYVLVGGLAVVMHGHFRATRIWIFFMKEQKKTANG